MVEIRYLHRILKSFLKSVNFTKIIASPGCNPSRASMLTGIPAYNSGMYSNYQDWRKVPALSNAITLPEIFKENGYFTAGAGKIYHYSQIHPTGWNEYFPSQKQNMPINYIPENAPVNMPPFKYMYSAFDWADLPIEDEETGDYKSVDYISSFFKKDSLKNLFFLHVVFIDPIYHGMSQKNILICTP